MNTPYADLPGICGIWTISNAKLFSFHSFLINSVPAPPLSSQSEASFCYSQALQTLFYLPLTFSPSLCMAGSLFFVLFIFKKIVLVLKIKFTYIDMNQCKAYIFNKWLHLCYPYLCQESFLLPVNTQPQHKANPCSDFSHHWFCLF